MNPVDIYPLPILVVDYILGAIMWTLIARSVFDLFFASHNDMVIIKVFRQLTSPIIGGFNRITPRFLAPFLIPLYVAWWFYMVRFYIIPLIFVGEIGMLSFPLESALGSFFRL